MRLLRDRRVLLGAALGFAAAGLFGFLTSPRTSPGGFPHGPLLADCEGALQEIVLQYRADSDDITGPATRAFLRQLPPGVRAIILCPQESDAAAFRLALGATACEVQTLAAGHTMTAWSRDRWLAFSPEAPNQPAVILAPRGENAAEIWPERMGDARTGDSLAHLLPDLHCERSPLYFDGGDFVADAETVLVTPQVAERNVGITVPSALALRMALEAETNRRVILLPDAPPYHAGMFMMPAGNQHMLVGDPSLGRPLYDEAGTLIADPDWSEASQARFDAVAASCKEAGYAVTRIPTVMDADQRTFLTYLNVIIDVRHGERIVYMPVFNGAEALNAAAEAIWYGLGYTVHPIDCTATYRHFGSLRCLVNVLRRA